MKKISLWLPIALIVAVFAIVFAYTFDRKLDLNGDNAYYYIYATSLTQGDGYSDISVKGDPPTSNYPPGYPVLMAPLRLVTESIIAQKVLNGLFLLGAALLLFFFLRATLRSQALALTAVLVLLLNYRVLEFATMMMSEMSYLFFLALTIWLLYRYDTSEKAWWRNPAFWLAIFCSAYAYLIRSQGVALIGAVVVWLLTTKRWREALAAIGGFVVLNLPWMIRNSILGLSGNRYLGQISAASHWRPEAGELGIGGIVERGFETLKMLFTKAIPNTVTLYLNVDYDAPTTAGEWMLGLLLAGVILFGFWQLRRYRWLLIAYTAFTLGIICLWSAPSGNRYLVTLVPLLEAGLVVGAYTLLAAGLKRISLKMSPLLLLIPAFFLARGPLEQRHQIAQRPVLPAYDNFYRIGEWARANLPQGSVISSRKPQLLYVSAHTYGCNYAWTQDDLALIRGLVDAGADFVMLEQLGYSSTGRYLYPAIVKHPDLFTPIYHLPNPDTYLIRFDREAAVKILE